jgi:hypothetical protein
MEIQSIGQDLKGSRVMRRTKLWMQADFEGTHYFH